MVLVVEIVVVVTLTVNVQLVFKISLCDSGYILVKPILSQTSPLMAEAVLKSSTSNLVPLLIPPGSKTILSL